MHDPRLNGEGGSSIKTECFLCFKHVTEPYWVEIGAGPKVACHGHCLHTHTGRFNRDIGREKRMINLYWRTVHDIFTGIYMVDHDGNPLFGPDGKYIERD